VFEGQTGEKQRGYSYLKKRSEKLKTGDSYMLTQRCLTPFLGKI
jgi:hypothetical protein